MNLQEELMYIDVKEDQSFKKILDSKRVLIRKEEDFKIHVVELLKVYFSQKIPKSKPKKFS